MDKSINETMMLKMMADRLYMDNIRDNFKYMNWMMERGYKDVGLGYFNCLSEQLIAKILLHTTSNEICLTCKYMYSLITSLSTYKLSRALPYNYRFIIEKYPNRYNKWGRIYRKHFKNRQMGRRKLISKDNVMIYKPYKSGKNHINIKPGVGTNSSMDEYIYTNNKDLVAVHNGTSLMIIHGTNIYKFVDCTKVIINSVSYTVHNSPTFRKILMRTDLYSCVRTEIENFLDEDETDCGEETEDDEICSQNLGDDVVEVEIPGPTHTPTDISIAQIQPPPYSIPTPPLTILPITDTCQERNIRTPEGSMKDYIDKNPPTYRGACEYYETYALMYTYTMGKRKFNSYLRSLGFESTKSNGEMIWVGDHFSY